MDGKWCEDIRFSSGIGYCMAGVKASEITTWKFCPICGAKRPEKPKGLADKMCEKVNAHNRNGFYSELAQVAFDHFREIVEAWKREKGMSTTDELLKRMEESL